MAASNSFWSWSLHGGNGDYREDFLTADEDGVKSYSQNTVFGAFALLITVALNIATIALREVSALRSLRICRPPRAAVTALASGGS